MNTATKLAVSNNRENKLRSILIILSIFLTTMLLTAIAIFGYGSVRNAQVNAGRFYGAYYGSFAGVPEETLQEIALRSEFEEIGRFAFVGSVADSEKGNLSLYYMDETARTMTNQSYNLAEGRFPETAEEIAGYRSFFQALGIESPKLGDAVELQYRKNLDHPYEKAHFVISGLLEEPGNVMRTMGAAFVSQAYYEEYFETGERSYTVYFTLNESVPINGGTGEQVIKELAVSCGLQERYASDNYPYLNWTINPGIDVILGCVAVGLIVVVFAVLVIYNIFQVGIVRKVQEYGKIKALGATKRQMKGIIFREGMMLAVVGVPLGLLAGVIAGKLFMTRRCAGRVRPVWKESRYPCFRFRFCCLSL